MPLPFFTFRLPILVLQFSNTWCALIRLQVYENMYSASYKTATLIGDEYEAFQMYSVQNQ